MALDSFLSWFLVLQGKNWSLCSNPSSILASQEAFDQCLLGQYAQLQQGKCKQEQ